MTAFLAHFTNFNTLWTTPLSMIGGQYGGMEREGGGSEGVEVGEVG
jgi:hypothetical protein